MSYRSLLPGLCLLAFAVPLVRPTLLPAAEDAEKKMADQGSSFLRVQRDDEGQPASLQTAIVRYRPQNGSGPEVDLIAAVHIGDKAYYDELNRRFQKYDAMLYELVAPPDEDLGKALKDRRSNHPVSFMQRGLKDMLKLDFQLDCVDYSAANFVHADMTPEEFAKSMRDRGESMIQILFRMLGQSMAQQSNEKAPPSDLELLVALFSKDRAFRLRRIMAEQFEQMDDATAALTGPEGSTLITERNKKALEVLRREMDGGKRRLAIFYGAGHLADFEQRLAKDFGLQPVETEWLVAWTLTEPAKAKKPAKTDQP